MEDTENTDEQLIVEYSKKTIVELKKLLVSFNPKAKKGGKKEDLISRIIQESKKGKNAVVFPETNVESDTDEVDSSTAGSQMKEPNKEKAAQVAPKPGVKDNQDVIKSVDTHQKGIADQSGKIKERKKKSGGSKSVAEKLSGNGDGKSTATEKGSVSVGLNDDDRVEPETSKLPKTKDGRLLKGRNQNNKGPFYDPSTGIFSYTAPYQSLKSNSGNTAQLAEKTDDSEDLVNKTNRKRKSEMNNKGNLKTSNDSEKKRKRDLPFGRYTYIDVDNDEKFINITEDNESYVNRSGPYIAGQILPNVQAPKSYCAKIFGPQTTLSNNEMAHYLKMNSDRAFIKQKSQESAPGSKAISKMDPSWISKGEGDSDKKAGRPKYSTDKVQHFSVKSGDAFSYAFPEQVHVIMASATKRLYDTVKSQTSKNAADSLVKKMAKAASLSIANMSDGIDRAILTGTLSGATVAKIDIDELMKTEDFETDEEDGDEQEEEEAGDTKHEEEGGDTKHGEDDGDTKHEEKDGAKQEGGGESEEEGAGKERGEDSAKQDGGEVGGGKESEDESSDNE